MFETGFSVLWFLVAVLAAVLLFVIVKALRSIAKAISCGDDFGIGFVAGFALIVLAILAIAALSPAGSRAEEVESKWQWVIVANSTKVEYDGEMAYLIEFTTSSGDVMSYYDDCNMSKGTELEVFINNGEVLDSVTKQEVEIQTWIICAALGFLVICIIWSIADGTF